MRKAIRWAAMAAVGAIGAGTALAAPIDTGELLYATEGNRLRRIDVDTVSNPPLREDVLIQNATDGEVGPSGGEGRDVNGMVCRLADGRLVMGEDTGQPDVPPGWGLFSPDGEQVGKLAAPGFTAQPEPFGCAVDGQGRLFTTEVGNPLVVPGNGQLILWFPPYEGYPGEPGSYPNDAYSTDYCVIADDIGAATGIAIDGDDVLVSSPRGNAVLRFSGAWPTGPDAEGGCGETNALGSPLVAPERITRSTFISDPLASSTASGLVRGPNGNWFVSEVLLSSISEFDPSGQFVRTILPRPPAPDLPVPNGNPQSLAFDGQGNLYYSDLDLRGGLFDPGTGPNGKVRRIRFDEGGNPLPPEIVRQGLRFPDGVSILPGDLEPAEWRTVGGSLSRSYFQPAERRITPANVGSLQVRWRYPTGAIVSASPTVATLDLPGEGRTPVTFFQSWDETVHAVRVADGTGLWSFETELQPGAAFPGASSATIATVDGEDVVFIGSGEILYAIDAVTGQERWRFTAGTGCRDPMSGEPPGGCGFQGERNQIESTPAVVGNSVYFGMDVNDVATGKGGFYGVDVATGQLQWFFDLESGQTCRPLPGDAVTRYDGYHSAEELGLPADWFSTRPGCDHPRSRNGCGNVWSSAAVDLERGLLFTASSNCDTDEDENTNLPPPPMPPFDEAIFALDLEGNAVWRWRPREIDNDDLAFGGVPNLFTIRDGEDEIDVLGVGNKDGTYYVLDRDGVNERNGVAWDDADPSELPYWRTRVVPGGAIGGIIASAAVDEERRRVLFATAPGEDQGDVTTPQRPTMHALDMDTGAVVWQGGETAGFLNDASYSPASAIPGVVFTGAVIAPLLRAWDVETGAQLFGEIITEPALFNAITSAAAVVDGTVIVGTGIGTRSGDPHDIGDTISREPREVVALWVPEPGPGAGGVAALLALAGCRRQRRHGARAALRHRPRRL